MDDREQRSRARGVRDVLSGRARSAPGCFSAPAVFRSELEFMMSGLDLDRELRISEDALPAVASVIDVARFPSAGVARCTVTVAGHDLATRLAELECEFAQDDSAHSGFHQSGASAFERGGRWRAAPPRLFARRFLADLVWRRWAADAEAPGFARLRKHQALLIAPGRCSISFATIGNALKTIDSQDSQALDAALAGRRRVIAKRC